MCGDPMHVAVLALEVPALQQIHFFEILVIHRVCSAPPAGVCVCQMTAIFQQPPDLVEFGRGSAGFAEGMNFTANSAIDLRSKLRSKGDVILTEIGLPQPPKKKKTKQAAANGKNGKAPKAPGSTSTKIHGGRAAPKAAIESQASAESSDDHCASKPGCSGGMRGSEKGRQVPLTLTSPLSPSLRQPLTEWAPPAPNLQRDEPGKYACELQDKVQKPAYTPYPMKVGIEIENRRAPLKVKSALEDQTEFSFDSSSDKYALQASIQELILQASWSRTAVSV